MEQKVFIEAHISDIHFGAIDPRTQYQILEDQFLNYLEDMNVLDIVSIDGDIFEHKFMANSDAVVYALKFISKLCDICKSKNATLILISGTGSHDADQLKLFTSFINYIDIRIIFETQFIYVKGKKILCIPEQYGMGREYYEKFLVFSGGYDACYMHGTFVGSVINKNSVDLDSSREPVFDIESFGGCKGPIISGHIHIHNTYKKDFYYCGSPIRYSFGEEEEKGFLILMHNISTRQYYIHLEPIYSFRYDTVNLDDMLSQDPSLIIQYIEDMKKQGIDHIRIIFTRQEMDKIALIKEYYRTRSDVVIKIKDIQEQRTKEELLEMEDRYKKYSYLFDDNLSGYNKLVMYMNQDLNGNIWTMDTLTQFLDDIRKL